MSPQVLKARREALGLNQTDMASYLGVSYWTYRNWEMGRRQMRTATAVLVGHALSMAESAHYTEAPLPNWRGLMEAFAKQGS